MSNSAAKIDLSGHVTQGGLDGEVGLKAGSQPTTKIGSGGATIEFTFENHKKPPFGIKIECRSQNDNFEFQNANGNATSNWEHECIITGQSVGRPAFKSVSVDIKPTVSAGFGEVETRIKIKKLTVTANPSVDDSIRFSIQ